MTPNDNDRESMNSKEYVQFAMDEVFQKIRLSKELSDSSLKVIINICGDLTVPALSIVDNEKSIKRVSSPSGRSVFQVTGSNDNVYTCLKDEIYCNCISFQNSVIMKASHVFCKHLLAVNIASALGNVEQLSESDACLNKLLMFGMSV